MSEKTKIAIMFVGQIRINGLYNNYADDNYILESIQKYLLNDKFIQTFDYDVFISTDNIDIDKCNLFFGEKLKNINIYEKEWFYNPISREIKSYKYFYDKYMTINFNGYRNYVQALHEMYRVYCAYNMVIDNETKNNKSYDMIIKIRLDSRLMQDLYELILFFIENNKKILLEHDHFIMVNKDYKELFDFINFFGTYQNIIDNTDSIFDYLFPPWAIEINSDNSLYFFCPERQILEYIRYLLHKNKGTLINDLVTITYSSYTILYRGNNSYGYSNYNNNDVFIPYHNFEIIKEKFRSVAVRK